MDTSHSREQHRFVSVDKAAAYIDAKPITIRRAVAAGRLTGYRMGTRILRVDLNEIDALLRPIPTADGAA